MTTSNLKEVSNIIAAWAATCGLIIGGIHAAIQYGDHIENRRVERTLLLMQRFNQPPLSNAYNNLEQNWTSEIRTLKMIRKSQHSRAEIIEQYNAAILGMIMHLKLDPDIRVLMNFFEEVIKCEEFDLCDRELTHEFFYKKGQVFYRRNYPYICELRRVWDDSGIGQSVKHHFIGETIGPVC